MKDQNKTCFVCNSKVSSDDSEINKVVFMPVCILCKNTKKEKTKEQELLDSRADGLIC